MLKTIVLQEACFTVLLLYLVHYFQRRTFKYCMDPPKPNLICLPLRSYHTQAAPPCIRGKSLQKSMDKLSSPFLPLFQGAITITKASFLRQVRR
jgi:hypothetical protein